MTYEGPARRCGVSSEDIAALLQGKTTAGIATRLGVSQTAVRAFLDGELSPKLAQKAGFSADTLLRLRNQIGREGAIGMLIGFMMVSEDA